MCMCVHTSNDEDTFALKFYYYLLFQYWRGTGHAMCSMKHLCLDSHTHNRRYHTTTFPTIRNSSFQTMPQLYFSLLGCSPPVTSCYRKWVPVVACVLHFRLFVPQRGLPENPGPTFCKRSTDSGTHTRLHFAFMWALWHHSRQLVCRS